MWQHQAASGCTAQLAVIGPSGDLVGRRALSAPDCARLVQGYFELAELGEFRLQGSREPLAVFELEGPGRFATRLDRSRARGFTRLVGRDDEIQLLENALEDALAGRGQVVGVVGEAGTGKSRLCDEFLERVMIGHINPIDPGQTFFEAKRRRIDLFVFRNDACDCPEAAGDARRADIGEGRQFAIEHLGIELVRLAIDVEPGTRKIRLQKWRSEFNCGQEQFVDERVLRAPDCLLVET